MDKKIFLPLAPLCSDVAMNTLLESPMANPTNSVLNIRFKTNTCAPASIVFGHGFQAV